tara:strand:- start:15 stop:290 length:276 start_codon:yes stop_codon:yes gene_type:complete
MNKKEKRMKEPETIFIEDKQPSLEEMQEFVGGYIEVVTLPDFRQMVINEEGKLLNLPINMVATNLFEKAFGIGTDVICGKAMILDKEALLD